MASALRKVDKIRQIVQLKLLVRRWRALSRRPALLPAQRRVPPGFLPVYVGPDCRRFVIPTRYLNLPVFVSLLNKAEEEYGYQGPGALVLPCEVELFAALLRVLDKDEERLRGLDLDDVLKMFHEKIFDQSCKDGSGGAYHHAFTPLLPGARV